MLKLNIYIISFIFSLILLSGCSDSPTSTNSIPQETLLYSRAGLVDSVVGTCSAYLIRTSIIDSLDTRNYHSLKVEFNSFTDGDLSEVKLYYLNDTITNLFSLSGTGQINGTGTITFPSPSVNKTFYLRLKLFASVCTGQYYSLRLRDLKIYGLN